MGCKNTVFGLGIGSGLDCSLVVSSGSGVVFG